MYGAGGKLWNGASFSVFATINANGISGVTKAKRKSSSRSTNGQWNISNVTMSANGDGKIPNSGNGFINETAGGGGNYSTRYGRTSFDAGDSAVILDITTGEILAMVNQPGFNPNKMSARKPGDCKHYW